MAITVKSFPIPDADQIEAMLDSSFEKLLHDYMENPPKYDVKEFITIKRQQLIEFLKANPNKAERYFQEQMGSSTTHDVPKIWRDGNNYFVAWMDHGRARNPRKYGALAEAVAELVLVHHGMY